MLIYFMFIFNIFLFYFLVFETPFFICNTIFDFTSFKYININYFVKYKDINFLHKLNVLHSKYDGKLISNILRVNNLKIKDKNIVSSDFENKLGDGNNVVIKYLNLDKNSFDNNYSNFVNIASNLSYFIAMKQKRVLKVGIIVNNRLSNNFNNGNFITFGILKVYPFLNFEKVLSNMKYSIDYAKNKTKKHFNLYDLYNLYNCDIILDSWRDLSYIKNKNGFEFFRYEKDILTSEKISQSLIEKKKKVIYLDYINNDYLISRIQEF